jgi:hypothetical protein
VEDGLDVVAVQIVAYVDVIVRSWNTASRFVPAGSRTYAP